MKTLPSGIKMNACQPPNTSPCRTNTWLHLWVASGMATNELLSTFNISYIYQEGGITIQSPSRDHSFSELNIYFPRQDFTFHGGRVRMAHYHVVAFCDHGKAAYDHGLKQKVYKLLIVPSVMCMFPRSLCIRLTTVATDILQLLYGLEN